MKVKSICSKLFLILVLMLTIWALYPQSSVKAKPKPKPKTITVTKIDQTTAEKVHRQLMKGKAFTIKFKCSEKNFYKKFQQLTKKVAKCTDIGFDVFPICAQDVGYYSGSKIDLKPKGGYVTFAMKKAYCEEYVYGIKFAERQLKAIRSYVDDVIAEIEPMYQLLISEEAKTWKNFDLENAIIDNGYTLTEFRELRRYLRETKFRDLSGAMKARMLLEIGGGDENPWTGSPMEHRLNGPYDDTFKALYRRKAYGRCVYIARAICKMCACYHIGEYECMLPPGDWSGLCVRIKVKTLGGETRYASLAYGQLDSYNKSSDYKFYNGVQYRKAYKKPKFPSTVSKNQRLRWLTTDGRGSSFWSPVSGDVEILVEKLNLDRSEW